MASSFEFHLKVFIGSPFKKSELDEWVNILNEFVKTKGDYKVALSNYYYEEHRGEQIGLFLFMLISGVADLLTITLALRELIRKKPILKEITIRVGEKEIIIKGNIEDSEIVKIIRESRKIEN